MPATDLQTVFAGLLVVLTAVYAWTTRRQLVAMQEALQETRRSNAATEKSNEIAERSLELGKRAWLIVSIERSSRASGSIEIKLNNVGGVPATDIIFRHQFFPNLPEEQPPTPAGTPVEGGTVGIGLQSTVVEALRPPTAGPDAGNDLQIWLLYCEIEYKDVFTKLKPRKTTACWWVQTLPTAGQVGTGRASKYNHLE